MQMPLWQIFNDVLEGGIIYLDCEDKQHLKSFYIDKNHYRVFGERYSNSDGIRYLQMIRFF
jgi:hypothetical protein